MTNLSVVMSAYNGQPYIEEAIKSVISQKDVDLELILIDDASTDGTRKVISQFTNPRSYRYDPRILFFSHERNQGIMPSYLDGIRLSSAEYFKILDQDDALPDEFVLARQKEALDANPELAFVAGLTNYIDEHSRIYDVRGCPNPSNPLDKKAVIKHLCRSARGVFQHGTLMVRREAFHDLGQALDTAFVIKTLASQRWQAGCLATPVLNYRTHGDNATNKPSVRFHLMMEKCYLAKELFPDQPLRRQFQIAYWAFWELAKIGYSSIYTKR
jgi:glycosyltransferase involved in cell wall biosynthesis